MASTYSDYQKKAMGVDDDKDGPLDANGNPIVQGVGVAGHEVGAGGRQFALGGSQTQTNDPNAVQSRPTRLGVDEIQQGTSPYGDSHVQTGDEQYTRIGNVSSSARQTNTDGSVQGVASQAEGNVGLDINGGGDTGIGADGDGVGNNPTGGKEPVDPWANYSEEEKAAGIWAREKFGGDIGAAMTFLMSIEERINAGESIGPDELAGMPAHLLKIVKALQDAKAATGSTILWSSNRGDGGQSLGMGAEVDEHDQLLMDAEKVREQWYGAPKQGYKLSSEETQKLSAASNQLNGSYADALKRVEAGEDWQSVVDQFAAGNFGAGATTGMTPETFRRINQLKSGIKAQLKQRGLEVSGKAAEQKVEEASGRLKAGQPLDAATVAALPEKGKAAYHKFINDVENIKRQEAAWVASGESPASFAPQGQWVKVGNWWENHQSQNAGGGFFGVMVDARTGEARGRHGDTFWPMRHGAMEQFKSTALNAVAEEKAAAAERDKIQREGDEAAQKQVEYNQKLMNFEARLRHGDTVSPEEMADLTPEDAGKLNELSASLTNAANMGKDFAGMSEKFKELMERIKAGEEVTNADFAGMSMDEMFQLADLSPDQGSKTFTKPSGVNGDGGSGEGDSGAMGSDTDDDAGQGGSTYQPYGGAGQQPDRGADYRPYGGAGQQPDRGAEMQQLMEQFRAMQQELAAEREKSAMGQDLFNRAEEIPESMRLAEEAAIERLKNPDNTETEQQMGKAMDDRVREIERQAIAQGLTWSGDRQEALGRTVEDIVKAGTAQMRADRDRDIQTAAQLGTTVFQTRQAQRDFALREAQVTGYYGKQPVMQLLMQQNEFDQQKMMQAGYTYTDPVTNQSTRVLGIDERADKDFLRAEDVRNGYSQVQTYTDASGKKVVIRNPHTGEPVLRKVMGTQELQQHINNEANRLQEKGLDADIAQSTAQLQWQKDQQSGFWATIETPNGPRQSWVTGSVGLEQERMALSKEMQELGFDQQTSERRAQQAYEDKIREGYTVFKNGKVINVRGTQDYQEHIMGLQQQFQVSEREAVQMYEEEQRVGYEKVVDTGRTRFNTRTGKEEPVYETVRIEGTQEFSDRQASRQDELVRDGWDADVARDKAQFENSEKQRTGYWKMETTYDQGGRPIEKLVWQEGSEANEAKIREDAQKHDISLQDARFAHDATQSSLARAQQTFLQARADQLTRQGWTRADALAEADRQWKSEDNAIARELSVTLADMQIQASKNMFDAEGHRELMNQSIGALGSLGTSFGPDLIKYFTGGGDPLAPLGWTKAGFESAGLTSQEADMMMDIGNSFLTDRGMPSTGAGWEYRITDGAGADTGLWYNPDTKIFIDPRTNMAWNRDTPSNKIPASEMGVKPNDGSPQMSPNAGALERLGHWYSGGTMVGAEAMAWSAPPIAAALATVYAGYKTVGAWKDYKKQTNMSMTEYAAQFPDDPEGARRVAEFDGWYDTLDVETASKVREELMTPEHLARYEGNEELAWNARALATSYKEMDGHLGNLGERRVRRWAEYVNNIEVPDHYTANVADLRSILDGGSFEKPLGQITVGEENRMRQVWDRLPKVARSGDTQGDVDFKQIVTDLAGFAGDMKVMDTNGWNDSYSKLRHSGILNKSVNNLTRDERELVNVVFDQADVSGLSEEDIRGRFASTPSERMDWLKSYQRPTGMGYDNDRA
jgi:hypothetical protein